MQRCKTSRNPSNAGAGEQRSGQSLYQRQQALRARADFSLAPTIVAAHLTAPENLGAVLRIADAVASAGVVFVDDNAPALAKIRRTARGTDAIVPWQVIGTVEFVERANAFQPLIAIELTTTSTNVFETNLPLQCTFVVGSEQHGIPANILALCESAVHVPMYGVNGSMNVTHALAIVLYEWRKQYSKLIPRESPK